MATDSAAVSGAPASSGVMDKGLKKGAIGYISKRRHRVASPRRPTRWQRPLGSSSR